MKYKIIVKDYDNYYEKEIDINDFKEKNVDILEYVSKHNSLRPKIVIGFAAETENLISNAELKLKEKGLKIGRAHV